MYEINYYTLGIIQIKNLVEQDRYNLYRNFSKDNKENYEYVKYKLNKEFGNFFTTESPLYHAMFTGILDCNKQKIPVKITKL